MIKLLTKTQETTTTYNFSNGWTAKKNHLGIIIVKMDSGMPVTETSITWMKPELLEQYYKIMEIINSKPIINLEEEGDN